MAKPPPETPSRSSRPFIPFVLLQSCGCLRLGSRYIAPYSTSNKSVFCLFDQGYQSRWYPLGTSDSMMKPFNRTWESAAPPSWVGAVGHPARCLTQFGSCHHKAKLRSPMVIGDRRYDGQFGLWINSAPDALSPFTTALWIWLSTLEWDFCASAVLGSVIDVSLAGNVSIAKPQAFSQMPIIPNRRLNLPQSCGGCC